MSQTGSSGRQKSVNKEQGTVRAVSAAEVIRVILLLLPVTFG